MAFDFRELAVPIIVAPMAGGPSTPALAAAGTNAGGLGFVAAGYLTAEVFADRITAARGLTSGPIGANLFVPQVSAGTPDGIARYAEALAQEAERYGAQLGEPRFDDDHWAAKLEVLLDKAERDPIAYRVTAHCHVDNTASARLLERSGLSYEGRLARYAILPNISVEPQDCLLFGKALR